jgi:hypothetical protein
MTPEQKGNLCKTDALFDWSGNEDQTFGSSDGANRARTANESSDNSETRSYDQPSGLSPTRKIFDEMALFPREILGLVDHGVLWSWLHSF